MAQNPVAALFGAFNQIIKPLQQDGPAALSNPAFFLVPAINHVLAKDFDCQRRLRQQAGKVLELRAEPIITRFQVGPEGFLQLAPVNAPATTTLTVALRDAVAALRDREKAMAATSIEGDVELAATLSYLVEHLRWDPEDDLAQVIGDARAVMVMRFFSRVAEGFVQTSDRLAAASREYVLHEQALVVSRSDLDRFADDVRRLRDDTARLEKRVERLSPGADPA